MSSTATGRGRRARRRGPEHNPLVWCAIAVVMVFSIVPVYWLVNTSLKTGPDLSTASLTPPRPTFENYLAVLGDSQFVGALVNSVIVASTTTLLALAVASFAAYPLARLKMRGKFLILSIVLSVTTFPGIAIAAPMFSLWNDLGLYNTLVGLIIPYLTFTLPLGLRLRRPGLDLPRAEQPSLNWRNPAVRQAMFEVMRFWLDRGVDGFRVDAVWRLIKDARLRDNPMMDDGGESFEIGGAAAHTTVRQIQKYTADQPELPGLLAQMHTVIDEYDDRMLMGELHLKLERVAALGTRGLDLAMNFSLIDAPWNGLDLAQLIQRYYAALPPGSHPNWVLSNHDRSRLASRIGPGRVPGALALLLTLKGTPTLYYGDELGLPDAPVDAGRARDCAELRAPGLGLGRDPQRMPMPWEATPPHAGFTPDDVEPWLPIPAWAGRLSVESQELDPRSLLSLVRELLKLRRELAALRQGGITVLSAHRDHLAYLRGDGEDSVLVAVNLSDRDQTVAFPGSRSTLWSSTPTAGERDPLPGAVTLAPFEARLLR